MANKIHAWIIEYWQSFVIKTKAPLGKQLTLGWVKYPPDWWKISAKVLGVRCTGILPLGESPGIVAKGYQESSPRMNCKSTKSTVFIKIYKGH